MHSNAAVQAELEQLAFPAYALKNTDASTVFKGLDADFPCVIRAKDSGPEPQYDKIVSGYKTYSHEEPFHMLRSKGGTSLFTYVFFSLLFNY